MLTREHLLSSGFATTLSTHLHISSSIACRQVSWQFWASYKGKQQFAELSLKENVREILRQKFKDNRNMFDKLLRKD